MPLIMTDDWARAGGWQAICGELLAVWCGLSVSNSFFTGPLGLAIGMHAGPGRRRHRLLGGASRRRKMGLPFRRGGIKTVNEARTGAKLSIGLALWLSGCPAGLRVKMELNGKGTRHDNSRKLP